MVSPASHVGTGPRGRLAAVACNVALAAFFAFFAAAHFAAGRRTGAWTTVLPIVAQEFLLVVLFLARRRSVATSRRRLDWAAGMVGVFLPLALRPHPEIESPSVVGQVLQVAGLGLSIAAIAFLGRSIGIVAANRGVKTAGPYAIIRHPMYAGHMVQYLGYLLSYPGLANAAVVAASVAAHAVRAIAEERLLRDDPLYAAYARRVAWRFVPYVL